MLHCEIWSACVVMEKQIKNQGRVGLERVSACQIIFAREFMSACEVMDKQMEKQGRVSLVRVSACQVMLACELMSGCGCHLVK